MFGHIKESIVALRFELKSATYSTLQRFSSHGPSWLSALTGADVNHLYHAVLDTEQWIPCRV